MAMTAIARFPLATLPTPLQPAQRLSSALGGSTVLLKRDDLTGFALAGNKARKLEYLLGDALAQGCDLLLTGGGPGSNHCQATAAAARTAGLACHVVMYGSEPTAPRVNLELVRLLGATVTFTGDPERSSVDAALEVRAAELRAAGRTPYVIPRGGASARGAIGYAMAVGELAAQLADSAVQPTALIVASGSCGTQAGLVAGTVAAGRPWRVIGGAVSRAPDECRARVLRLSRECADLLGWPSPESTDVTVEDVRGPGYAVASDAGRAAAAQTLQAEGVLLDPVFTAKAMGLLITLVQRGLRGPLVFVHTGGIPAVLESAMRLR